MANMARKRVLLIESGQFIGGVIHSLFSTHEQLTVIESSPANVRELMKAVRNTNPHIVVMDDTVSIDYLSHLLGYMQNTADLRVVVVNTNENELEVYQKQQVHVSQTADLFAVL
jgi:chemotaxis response regulator CheB